MTWISTGLLTVSLLAAGQLAMTGRFFSVGCLLAGCDVVVKMVVSVVSVSMVLDSGER